MRAISRFILFWVFLLAMTGAVDAALVAHYRFDQNANDSVGGYDGTEFNVPLYVETNVNFSINFTDADLMYVTIPDPEVLRVEEKSYSLSWFYNPLTLFQRHIIYRTNPANVNGFYFEFVDGNNSLVVCHFWETTQNDCRYSAYNYSATDSFTHWVVTYDNVSQTMRIYVNGSLNIEHLAFRNATANDDGENFIGQGGVGDGYAEGRLDEFKFYDHVLAQPEVDLDFLINQTNDTNILISVIDHFTGFNVDGVSVNLSTDQNTSIPQFSVLNQVSPFFVDITEGYVYQINVTAADYFSTISNAALDVTAAVPLNVAYNLSQNNINVTFANNITEGDFSYVRIFNYTLDFVCDGNGTVNRLVNGVANFSHSFNCSGSSAEINNSFRRQPEGLFNISFAISSGYFENISSSNFSFSSDLFNPNISLSASVSDTFSTVINFTASMICNDTYHDLGYNFTVNTLNLFDSNLSAGTELSNTTNLTDGTNQLNGSCSDLFGSTEDDFSFTGFTGFILLWDELENVAFDEQNLTNVRLWFADNASFYDFKANSRSNISFASVTSGQLRLELEYSTGDIIVRYIDSSILEDDTLLICANKEGITHFEQLVVAATEKEVIIQNTYSRCYIAADFTRFAYQDALLLRAFTTDSLYVLYTLDDGAQVILASLDGSVSTFINLDTLEFERSGFNLDILGDALAFEQTGTNTIAIYYRNIDADNEAATLTITRLDTNVEVLSTSSILNPNNFTVFFDYSTLTVNDSTLFAVEIETTDSSGLVESFTRYFNTGGSTGILHAGLAFIISFILTVFGMTFATARATFSWFGIFILLAAIAVLSFSVSAWYVLMLMAIEIIMLVYVVIVMVQQGTGTVT